MEEKESQDSPRVKRVEKILAAQGGYQYELFALDLMILQSESNIQTWKQEQNKIIEAVNSKRTLQSVQEKISHDTNGKSKTDTKNASKTKSV